MSGPLTITFDQAKQAGACTGGYRRMARLAGKSTKYVHDEPHPISIILDNHGLYGALWALRVIKADAVLRLWAADCAEHVLPLFATKYPGDDRPRKSIEAARAFARGKSTQQGLAAARAGALAAAQSVSWPGTPASDARGAALAAAWAADSTAARAAGWVATQDDSWHGATVPESESGPPASPAEKAWRVERLRQYLSGAAS